MRIDRYYEYYYEIFRDNIKDVELNKNYVNFIKHFHKNKIREHEEKIKKYIENRKENKFILYKNFDTNLLFFLIMNMEKIYFNLFDNYIFKNIIKEIKKNNIKKIDKEKHKKYFLKHINKFEIDNYMINSMITLMLLLNKKFKSNYNYDSLDYDFNYDNIFNFFLNSFICSLKETIIEDNVSDHMQYEMDSFFDNLEIIKNSLDEEYNNDFAIKQIKTNLKRRKLCLDDEYKLDMLKYHFEEFTLINSFDELMKNATKIKTSLEISKRIDDIIIERNIYSQKNKEEFINLFYNNIIKEIKLLTKNEIYFIGTIEEFKNKMYKEKLIDLEENNLYKFKEFEKEIISIKTIKDVDNFIKKEYMNFGKNLDTLLQDEELLENIKNKYYEYLNFMYEDEYTECYSFIPMYKNFFD